MIFTAQLLTLLFTLVVGQHSDKLPVNFNDATLAIFGGPLSGYLAAFADLNADRITDVIVISDNNTFVYGYLMQGGSTSASSSLAGSVPSVAEKRVLFSLNSGSTIRSVTPADFDGDAVLDLALCIAKNIGEPLSIQIAWGNTALNSLFDAPVEVAQMVDQPTLLDWNADIIADLLGENLNGDCVIVLGDRSRNLTTLSSGFLFSKDKLSRGPASSHSFAAFDSSMQAALLLTLNRPSGINRWADLFFRTKIGFGNSKAVDLNVNLTYAALLGQAAVTDLNADDRLELVLPVCQDDLCDQSEIWTWNLNSSTWHKADVDWSKAHLTGFQPPKNDPLDVILGAGNLALQLRPGDVNADGFVDLLTVARGTEGGRHVTLLVNKGNGTFQAIRCGPAMGVNVSQVAWFDLREDGLLDLLITRATLGRVEVVAAQRSRFSEEGYFLKVMVLEGHCRTGKCDMLPYGLPTPGPVLRYETESSEDKMTQTARASQNAQNVYNALALPFVHFGLGPYANYVEKLSVSIPWPTIDNDASINQRSHVFSFIVPNAQMVVLPMPIDNPAQWSSKLFVRPIYDRQVLFVGVTLLGTCAFVVAILGLLQWREVREDRLEKLQEAQKFHFDAM